MKFIKQLLAGVIMTAALVNSALAQATASVVLSTGPGGGMHRTVLMVQEQLASWLGEPVTLEFKPGGFGLIAADYVKNLPNDGKPHFLVGGLQNDMKQLDQARDIKPVVEIGTINVLLVARKDIGATDLADLVKKIKGSEITFAFTNGGSIQYYTDGLFKHLEKSRSVTVRQVPYKSSSQVQADLLGGHVDTAILSGAAARPLIDAGKIVPLAVLGRVRSLATPEVKSVAEQGFKFEEDFYRSHTMLWASPGTDDKVIADVRSKWAEFVKSEAGKETLRKIDHTPPLENFGVRPDTTIINVLARVKTN